MPVVRVPVVHKFGIVSVSRAEQLLREGRGDQNGGKHAARPVKAAAPTKISQSFIAKYNATPETERGRLDNIVHRTFSQAKYKAGLHKTQKNAGSPTHASLCSPPLRGVFAAADDGGGEEGRVCDAWLEFILLCQCYGPHQEDVLLALATSLNHAPLSSAHIPSLLYMCGLCYQWLKSDLTLGQMGQLRTGELLLLRILYLISLRLFYYHMVETLQDTCTREDIRQLKFDLEGFESREKVYRNFPEALLHWRVALEVGQAVVEKHSPALHDPSGLSGPEQSPDTTTKPSTSHGSSAHEGGRGGEGGHSVSPVLWHSLDVWQVVRGAGPGQEDDAIADLLACSTEFDIDNWMESLLAINILCLGSQLSLRVLSLLHSLASGTTAALVPHSSPTHPSLFSSSPRHHHQHRPPHDHTPLLLGSDTPHSGSLFNTPTTPSRTSEGTGRTDGHNHRRRSSSLSPKKGTRFQLPPGLDILDPPSLSNSKIGSDLAAASKRRAQVDTLNVLGVQPGFKEPYPESAYTGAQTVVSDDVGTEGGTENGYYLHLHVDIPHVAGLSHDQSTGKKKKSDMSSRHATDLESVATQSLVGSESVPTTLNSSRASSHSQHLSGIGDLGSQSTLGEASPSQSLVVTSSPWLKSGTSKLLDLFGDDQAAEEGEGGQGKKEEAASGSRGSSMLKNPSGDRSGRKESMDEMGSPQGTWGFRAASGTPIEDKLKALESPLGETIDRVGLLGNHDRFRGLHPPARPPGVSGRSVTLSLFGRNVETRCTHYTHSSAALSGGAGVPGSHIAPSTVYRHSVYSMPLTLDMDNDDVNVESAMLSGSGGGGGAANHARFETWPCEVALAYTLSMAGVVVYGRTSLIQSTALEGMGSGDGGRGGKGRVEGYGLKQLAQFTHMEPSPTTGKLDFSAWGVRHSAVLGLSRVSRACKQLPMKDGLSGVAWSALVHCHSAERDSKVLEAFKMSQVCPDLDGPLLAMDPDSLSSPLLACMADALARVFLPPMAQKSSSAATTSSSKTPARRLRPSAVKTPSHEIPAKVDTWHKSGGVLRHPDFTARTLAALHSIVKQDWKREMQRELAEQERAAYLEQENQDNSHSSIS